MAMVYATLIIKGVRTFASVPAILKDKVRQILIDLDMAELATEETATPSNAAEGE